MGSSDFVSFTISFLIDSAMVVVEVMYWEPLLGFLLELFGEAWSWLKQIVGARLDERRDDERNEGDDDGVDSGVARSNL